MGLTNYILEIGYDPEPSANVPAVYLPSSMTFIHWSRPRRAYPGIDLDFKMTGYDWFNHTLVWSLDVAPSGMTINSVTGVLSWTPSAQDGDHTVTVSMRPGTRVPITLSWTITVGTANHIFMATDGNDTTGTGLIGAPYLTLEKCFTQITTGNAQTVIARGGTYFENFRTRPWHDNSPLVGKTFSKTNSLLFTSYPGEQALFDLNNVSYGPKMNGGESKIIFDKIHLIRGNGDPFICPNTSAFKRCKVTESDWSSTNNVTGFVLWGDVLLDSCYAANNYDRAAEVHYNSSNYTMYADVAGTTDSYLIDCESWGGGAQPGGFKEKHSGPWGNFHMHRCVSRAQRPFDITNDYSSVRHSIGYTQGSSMATAGGIEEVDGNYSLGLLYQENLVIQNAGATGDSGFTVKSYAHVTTIADKGNIFKGNIFLLNTAGTSTNGSMMSWGAEYTFGSPDFIENIWFAIVDNEIYSPSDANLMEYSQNNMKNIAGINALTASSGNFRTGVVPATYDFPAAGKTWRYDRDAATLVEL